jgi:hypothetical protein
VRSRWNPDRLADLATWTILALIAWRIYRASRLESWRDGFRAGFNAAPIGARAKTNEEVAP